VAADKTKLTELGTAVGLLYEPQRTWPEAVEELEIPGIEAEVWQPVVLPSTAAAAPDRQLLLTAVGNGREFRRVVLRDRIPANVEWSGGGRTTWSSDIPRDLTVDNVYFIQAKYDSTCVLNTSPASVFDELLVEGESGPHDSWYDTVAPLEHQAYYQSVTEQAPLDELPFEVGAMAHDHRLALKEWMRGVSPGTEEAERYRELCRAVSTRTADRWQARLRSATLGQQTRMLFRMLRIAGGPYWLLGTKGVEPVRLAVADTQRWRDQFDLRALDVQPAQVGQPQVNWQATVADRRTKVQTTVVGYCEIRWSHGKLQGAPECKVQVTTALHDLPGYGPMSEQ
jgi:hypothetical protein